jgi:hypothetical protein
LADLTAMAHQDRPEPDAADADESIAAEIAEHEVGREVAVEQGAAGGHRVQGRLDDAGRVDRRVAVDIVRTPERRTRKVALSWIAG